MDSVCPPARPSSLEDDGRAIEDEKMINNTAQRLHRPPIGGKDLYVECRSLEN